MESLSFSNRPESQPIPSRRERLSQQASQLRDAMKSVVKKIFSKEPEIFHLGGIKTASVALGEGLNLYTGKTGSYFHERIPITVNDQEVHFYQGALKPFVKEWMEARRSGATQEEFRPYLEGKLKSDEGLRASLMDKAVRYFDDQARAETVTTMTNGALHQIGLDSKATEKKPMQAGKYAFVLARTIGENGELKTELFASPKAKTEKGKVQHSSFTSSGQVVSAGMLQVDQEGRILSVENLSGHYRPSAKELAELVSHLNRAGYDTSKFHVTCYKTLASIVLNMKFPRIKWGIVTQRADKWYAETGSKLVSPETTAMDAKWESTKTQALALIKAHGWEINDFSPQHIHLKLNEIADDLEFKIAKPAPYVDLNPFRNRSVECLNLLQSFKEFL